MHWALRTLLVLAGSLLILVSLGTYSKPPYWEVLQSAPNQGEQKTLAQQNPTHFCIALLIVGGTLIVVGACKGGSKILP